MHRIRIRFALAFFAIVLCLMAPIVYGMTFPSLPVGGFYVDDARLIQPNAGKEINQIANRLWVERHISLFVATIPSLETEGAGKTKIEDYAKALFDHWNLGAKGRDNILLLVSKEDRQSRIELGIGWSHNYDSQADNIMNNVIVTEIKNGNFSAAIVKGVHSLDTFSATICASGANTVGFFLPPWMSVAGFIIIVLLVIGIISLKRTGRNTPLWHSLSGPIFSILRKLPIIGRRFDE